jgi:hypothetical protein
MADNTNRIAGTAYLSIDGTSYPLVGDFEYSPGLVERDSMAGMDGVHGYSEKPVAPFIAGTIRDSGGLKVADINAMTNVSIVCELANGKVVTGSSMWNVQQPSAKSAEATIEARWEGLQGSVVEN